MYLVDTSVWVDFLRGGTLPHVEALKRLLEDEEPVGVAPPILQEILQGAESPERFRKWERYFGDLACYEPIDQVASAIEAARLYVACRRAGVTPRSSIDCLIARIAIEHDLILVHNDRDFEKIVRVEPHLRLLPSIRDRA